jgi:hypothetical protein
MGGQQTYDLAFTTGGKFFFWRNPNCGVTLKDGALSWRAEGRHESHAIKEIASVHLESGGTWQDVIDKCDIAFQDATRLVVTSATDRGVGSAERVRVYRDFVRALHEALRQAGPAPVRFTAGYGETRYRVVLVCAALLALILVVLPLGLWIMALNCRPSPADCGIDSLTCVPARECPESGQVFLLMLTSAIFLWPLYRMVKANAPRSYSPDSPPEDLLG